MKPDLEAIRARVEMCNKWTEDCTFDTWAEGMYLSKDAAKDIPALLAYVDSLERVREAAVAVERDFPPIEEKRFKFDGMRDKKYLSPSASMIDSKFIVALRAALSAAGMGK